MLRRDFHRILVAAGGILLAMGLTGIGWTAFLIGRPALSELQPAQHFATTTPFLPESPTPTHAVQVVPEETLEEPQQPEPRDEFAQLEDGEAAGSVRLSIEPPEQVNSGQLIQLAFTPGVDCAYGTRKACVSRHLDGKVTLLTIHSGLGGEGESFRIAVEGSGLNLVFFPLERIGQNLRILSGSRVRLQMGDAEREDLFLEVVVRVPPSRLEAYFSQPFDDALAAAAQDEPALQTLLEQDGELLVFEICGWQLPGEAWAEGVSPSTGSIYLGFIRLR